MPLYETVFLTRQDLSVSDVDELSEELSKILTKKKGKLVSKEYWGLKNLPYKINKNSRAHYVLLNIDAPHAAIAEMRRIMSYNEKIIRHNTFLVEEHTKNPSSLMLSVEAKDYKTGATSRAPSAADAVIDQIVINT